LRKHTDYFSAKGIFLGYENNPENSAKKTEKTSMKAGPGGGEATCVIGNKGGAETCGPARLGKTPPAERTARSLRQKKAIRRSQSHREPEGRDFEGVGGKTSPPLNFWNGGRKKGCCRRGAGARNPQLNV